VIPAQRWRDPGSNLRPGDAGISAHVHPHVMRHAFGYHVARHVGIKNAQALLGHADVGTTQIYTGAPTLDELAAAVEGFRFALEIERAFCPLAGGSQTR
jgi:integrase